MDYSVFKNFYVYGQDSIGEKQADLVGKGLVLPSGRMITVEDKDNPLYVYAVLREGVMYMSTGCMDRAVIDGDIVILSSGIILLFEPGCDEITMVSLSSSGHARSEKLSLYEYDLMLSRTDDTGGLPVIKWNAELQKYELEQWLEEHFCKAGKITDKN